MGVDTTGWVRHKGLRVTGGGQVVEVDWPTLERWPGHSLVRSRRDLDAGLAAHAVRSEEHTSELQSRQYLVCRLLLEKKTFTSISQNLSSYLKYLPSKEMQ